MNKRNIFYNLGIADVLLMVFIVLKIGRVIDWSWWWILSPIWIGVIILYLVDIFQYVSRIVDRRQPSNEPKPNPNPNYQPPIGKNTQRNDSDVMIVYTCPKCGQPLKDEMMITMPPIGEDPLNRTVQLVKRCLACRWEYAFDSSQEIKYVKFEPPEERANESQV